MHTQCNMYTQSRARAHAHTEGEYLNRPSLEQSPVYRCIHVCSPPRWSQPFICLLLETLMQGSDPFSQPTENLAAFSKVGCVYIRITMLP